MKKERNCGECKTRFVTSGYRTHSRNMLPHTNVSGPLRGRNGYAWATLAFFAGFAAVVAEGGAVLGTVPAPAAAGAAAAATASARTRSAAPGRADAAGPAVRAARPALQVDRAAVPRDEAVGLCAIAGVPRRVVVDDRFEPDGDVAGSARGFALAGSTPPEPEPPPP